MVQWRRRSALFWTIACFVASFSILWALRRFSGRRESVAIEEYGWTIAPLIAFALLWLLVDSVQRPKSWLGWHRSR
ncbi:MAG: hypothetical protein JWL71_3339 [Acidobacteria bacterium]|jgi:hypothetical protein|nr:hypothetical protein [Acidobacteriota bacterium]